MKTAITAFALVLSACAGSSEPPIGQPAQLGHLTYDGPLAWTHTESQRPRGPSSTWLPEDNVRKESIIITRAKLEPGRPALTSTALQELLVTAQKDLPHANLSRIEPFTSPRGLQGVRVEADFVPTGLKVRYHRIHAVMVDGDSLVHVLYTALEPDDRAFELVVNSVHGEA